MKFLDCESISRTIATGRTLKGGSLHPWVIPSSLPASTWKRCARLNQCLCRANIGKDRAYPVVTHTHYM